MTKMSGFLESKKNIIVIIGVFCIIILSGAFLTNSIGAANKDKNRHDINTNLFCEYNPGDLFVCKSQYIEMPVILVTS